MIEQIFSGLIMMCHKGEKDLTVSDGSRNC